MDDAMATLDDAAVEVLRRKAFRIRRMTLECIGAFGAGHVGGSLSIVEILTVLYYRVMEGLEPGRPGRGGRDTLVLSKGHGSPALYAVLADIGYIPYDWLSTLNRNGTNLPSHCDMRRTPGVDFTTGSLGQGASAAAGMALANRLLGDTAYTYCILGDGECQEGQVWEMALFSAQFQLDRLVVFLDCNGLQFDGPTREVLNLEDLELKWTSFGWNAARVDGHDFYALAGAAEKAKLSCGRPSIIICDTVKAKGLPGAEGEVSSHHRSLSPEQIRVSTEALMREEAADEASGQLC